MLNGVPYQQSAAISAGVAAGNPVSVPGIRSGDRLLAVVRFKLGTGIDGLDPSDFVVADGEIESAAVDTATYRVYALWTHNA